METPEVRVEPDMDIENPEDATEILAAVVQAIEAGQTSGVVHGYEWELDDTLDFSQVTTDASLPA